MSFADDVRELSRKRPQATPCKTGVWLSGLEESERRAFEAYISEPARIAGSNLAGLHRITIKHGFEGGLTQFKEHCRTRCSCYRGMENAA